jgi:multiple sugar transport system permease protein
MPPLRRVAEEGSFYGLLSLLVVFAAFPFYWMLITTFKAEGDLYDLKSIPYWFNVAPTLSHLRYLFAQTLFLDWLINSLIIGLCVVAITLVVALPAGYSLARLAGRNAETLGVGIFLTIWCRRLYCSCRCRGSSRSWGCKIPYGRSWSSIRPSRSRSAPGC